MAITLILAAVGIACLALGLRWLFRRLSLGPSLPVTVERYRPMLRLLEGDDLRFLQLEPSFTPVMEQDFRRERCRIFRSYLQCLQLDFQRVSMALKVVMVQSRYDRPDLAAALVRTQRAFAFGMLMVYGRLLLYRWGLGSVEVGGLLRVFDSARLELRSLVPVGMAA
jgi:hypothetical protein